MYCVGGVTFEGIWGGGERGGGGKVDWRPPTAGAEGAGVGP